MNIQIEKREADNLIYYYILGNKISEVRDWPYFWRKKKVESWHNIYEIGNNYQIIDKKDEYRFIDKILCFDNLNDAKKWKEDYEKKDKTNIDFWKEKLNKYFLSKMEKVNSTII